MKIKTEKEIIIDRIERSNSQTTLLSGHWGFGKTMFAKNELTTHFQKKGYEVFYLDSRIISFQNNILQYVGAVFNTILSNDSANKEKAKKVGRTLAKGLIWGINGFFNKSFDFDKLFKSDKNASKKIKKITKNSKIIFIVDELDRNDGYVLLKVLNFINLIAMQADGNKNFKIIGIGNSDEILQVIKMSLGYERGNNKMEREKFITKYFGQEIDINEIWKESMVSTLNKYYSNNRFYKILFESPKIKQISPRKMDVFMNFFTKNTKFKVNSAFLEAFILTSLVENARIYEDRWAMTIEYFGGFDEKMTNYFSEKKKIEINGKSPTIGIINKHLSLLWKHGTSHFGKFLQDLETRENFIKKLKKDT